MIGLGKVGLGKAWARPNLLPTLWVIYCTTPCMIHDIFSSHWFGNRSQGSSLLQKHRPWVKRSISWSLVRILCWSCVWTNSTALSSSGWASVQHQDPSSGDVSFQMSSYCTPLITIYQIKTPIFWNSSVHLWWQINFSFFCKASLQWNIKNKKFRIYN